MACGGEKAEDRIMARSDTRMRQTGDDGEVSAEFLERFEVRRERVVFAGLLREKERRMHAQRRADRQHAADRRRVRRRIAA